jgi:hypothetical protein
MLSTLLPLLQAPQGLGQTTLETVMTLDLHDYILRPVIAVAVGLALAIVYRSTHKGLSYSQSFMQTIVFVSLVVALVMMTVRNSLATAFTLVGALSIIRFRTPIKEPEELAYLFLSIGLGLGLGANQYLITGLVYAVVLGYMALISLGRTGALPPRLLVHVAGQMASTGGKSDPAAALQELLRSAQQGAARVDLRRIDTEGASFNATLVLDLERAEEVGPLLSRLQLALPGSSISVVEGNALE